MIIISSCILIFIIATIIYKLEWEILSISIFTMNIFYTMIIIASLLVNISSFYTNLASYKALKISIENARKMEVVERTAIQFEIIKTNKWIYSERYWNNTLFDIWITDIIEEIEIIK